MVCANSSPLSPPIRDATASQMPSLTQTLLATPIPATRLGYGTSTRAGVISSSLPLALKQVRVFRPPRSGLASNNPFLDLDISVPLSLSIILIRVVAVTKQYNLRRALLT